MVDVLNAPFNDGEEGQQQPTAVNVNSRTIAVDMQVIDALNVQYTPVEDALFMYETYLQAQPIAEETGTMVVLAENEIGYTGIEFLPQPEQTFQNNIRTFEVLVDSIKEFNSGNMPDPSLTYQDNLGMLLFGVQDLRNLIQNPEYMEEFETILMAYDLDMTAFESIVSQLKIIGEQHDIFL